MQTINSYSLQLDGDEINGVSHLQGSERRLTVKAAVVKRMKALASLGSRASKPKHQTILLIMKNCRSEGHCSAYRR